MYFLADEGCDFAVVKALRAAGHDVQTVREQHGDKLPGSFAVLQPHRVQIVPRAGA